MPPHPASAVIRSFVDRYPVYPRLQTTVTVKLSNAFEDLYEHILQDIGRLSRVL